MSCLRIQVRDFFNGFANVSIGAKKFSVDVNGIKYKEKLCLNRDLDHYIFNNDLSEESVLEKLIDYKNYNRMSWRIITEDMHKAFQGPTGIKRWKKTLN